MATQDGGQEGVDAGAEGWDAACAYIVGYRGAGHGSPVLCGAALRARSPYCPHHHALCHLRRGTAVETNRLREVEALAAAVGGRRGRDAERPPELFLRRLERAARHFFRDNVHVMF